MSLPLFRQLSTYMSHFSIKRLTMLGFVFVITPLLGTLLFLGEQTKRLSSEGAQSILEVSLLVESNRMLNQALSRAERFASQYVVLKEEEILDRFTVEHFKINSIVDGQLGQSGNDELNSLLNSLSSHISFVAEHLPSLPENFNELTEIEQRFQHISENSSAIRQLSEQLIQQQAHHIRNQSKTVDALVLKSLLILPITLVIAGLFIYLISHPLKALISQIQTLQQSKFDQKITSSGSTEVQEIANALDVMRTRLQALELQKSSFIRHISHELKTPLAAIREGSTLLDDNSLGELNDGQREVSKIILHSVHRLQQLIEDLLAFNIVLDSTSLQDSAKLNVSEIIENVTDQHKLAISRKHIDIKLELAPVGVISNKKQLTVIVENLLSNAIKYTPENGNITISLTLKNPQMTLSVTDSGSGINAEELPHIFDAFYQGKKPTDTHIKSSGLGLTIVKELVMRLNGTIDVDSINKQQPTGTIFTLTLPRAYQLGG